MTLFVAVTLICLLPCLHASLPVMETVNLTGIHDWGNRFEGMLVFPIVEDVYGWEVTVHFNYPVILQRNAETTINRISADNRTYVLVNKLSDGSKHNHTTTSMTIIGRYNRLTSDPPIAATAALVNLIHDGQVTPSTPPAVASEKYNYAEVLEKSILFYEAQRSGKLPSTNRIPWRGDSALTDHGQNGEDLSGGWYDAGDHLKFGFPLAGSVSMLAWGLIEFKDAYAATGQLDNMYDCIRWPLEWLMKAHTGRNELYVQVGDGDLDHHFWGRPEDMTMARPSYKITEDKPGSDVAAEYAAAMASGYIAFKDKEPAFAAKLLTHAREIYAFALEYNGTYSKSLPQSAAQFYGSSDYDDEMCWGGAWLYLATGEDKYLTHSKNYNHPGTSWGQSWGNKDIGCKVLLHNVTGEDRYAADITGTFTNWMPGGNVPYLNSGLALRNEWGSLRHTANMAFIALVAAENGLNSAEYRAWAKSQIHIALGDTGRSFVVGFGVNPPSHPHHRSSSCPMMPAPCSQEALSRSGSNPHTLYGGLVGGPSREGSYKDNRQDYQQNEVACDYNAGFQSAVAGLKHLSITGQLS
ncbi:endoglucanase E-4-like isoform X2 [Pecten maximus]|uniref:endoglucanase E-4-like isoform X2 n=1 Tax=Pecten maximus TaxID=6579 RepID=UPI0014584421|nr:endoglucanase E-4-like isoform X2 [Pecten maximus]